MAQHAFARWVRLTTVDGSQRRSDFNPGGSSGLQVKAEGAQHARAALARPALDVLRSNYREGQQDPGLGNRDLRPLDQDEMLHAVGVPARLSLEG